MTHHALNILPPGALCNKIEAEPVVKDGRAALRLALDGPSRAGVAGVDFVDQPSFLLLPDVLRDGAVEVDLCARLLPDAPEHARGFIGLAYRVQPDLSAYESLYLRPTNGRPHAPGAPRDARAVQYYAYPDWPFDVLRDREPGRFEAGADIALDRWTRLRIAFSGRSFAAFADGQRILTGDGKIDPMPGRVGLWVDIGTEGFFANLTVDGAGV